MKRDRPMTDMQRRALHLASHKRGAVAGAEIVSAHKATGAQVTTAMANKVVARGWAERQGDHLVITDEGRSALRAPMPELPPVFLKERDQLTHRRDMALLEEGEVIDPDTLDDYWEEQSLRGLAPVTPGDKRKKAKSRTWVHERRRAA